jgi:hypothetical protein
MQKGGIIMHKKLVLLVMMIFALGVVFVSCAGMQVKPTAANFKAPIVTLDSIQVSYYEGFWYYGNAKPAMGEAPKGGGSSPVGLDFVFEITNPNDFPVRLDSARFFLYFDDYELRDVNDENPMWIPAGKTNTKVLNVTLTPFSTYAKFLLAGKQLAIKRGDKPWDKIKEWWTGLPDMSFPIDLKEGAFTFMTDGLVKVVPIDAKYP